MRAVIDFRDVTDMYSVLSFGDVTEKARTDPVSINQSRLSEVRLKRNWAGNYSASSEAKYFGSVKNK